MQVPTRQRGDGQLDLLEQALSLSCGSRDDASAPTVIPRRRSDGRPLHVPVALLVEDPDNPGTDTIVSDLDDLVQDIRERGVLQPIVVHPADAQGRHRIHLGARQWRAAQQAGLESVPVVVRHAAADAYAQVAENQVRRGLSPIELARFIKSRVDAGETNAAVARRIGMNLTSVAHHLTLLDLPPELDQAMQSGRCTSPRTLHELTKLRDVAPGAVHALVAGDAEITRASVGTLRMAAAQARSTSASSRSPATLLTRAEAACSRLDRLLDGLTPASLGDADRGALHRRLMGIASRLEPRGI
jgi:ParB family chromosome partitioning protein